MNSVCDSNCKYADVHNDKCTYKVKVPVSLYSGGVFGFYKELCLCYGKYCKCKIEILDFKNKTKGNNI